MKADALRIQYKTQRNRAFKKTRGSMMQLSDPGSRCMFAERYVAASYNVDIMMPN